jgi:hypothetical protein
VKSFPTLLPVLLGVSGCMLVFPVPNSGRGCQGESADWFPAADVVRVRGENELDCAATSLDVQRIGENSYRVSGCGVFEEYTCESDAVPGCSLEEAAERESCLASE